MKYYWGHQITEDETDGVCGTRKDKEIQTSFWWGSPLEKTT
jgi:hypothetical protein